MKVQNISFGARYIHSVKIDKTNGGQKHKAALIELDPKNEHDNSCVQQIIQDWGGIDSYTYDIAHNMGEILCDLHDDTMPIPRFFAITSQRSNFNKLIPEALLSLSEITELKNGIINIDFLETMHEQAHNAKRPMLKHIGTKMLDCVKKIYKGKTLELNSTNEAIGFYLKNGFIKKAENFNRFMFKA